jgi:hypothetical protein
MRVLAGSLANREHGKSITNSVVGLERRSSNRASCRFTMRSSINSLRIIFSNLRAQPQPLYWATVQMDGGFGEMKMVGL